MGCLQPEKCHDPIPKSYESFQDNWGRKVKFLSTPYFFNKENDVHTLAIGTQRLLSA